MEDEQPFSDLEAALKRSAAALRRARSRAGRAAGWVGTVSFRHDLDLMIKPDDVDRAVAALTETGMRFEDPPEEWLVKAYDGDTLIDLIFAPKGIPMNDEAMERGRYSPFWAWRCA